MGQFNSFNQGRDYPPEGVITPGIYGDAAHFPRITVNSRGFIVRIELIEYVRPGPVITEFADLDGQQMTDLDGQVITDFS